MTTHRHARGAAIARSAVDSAAMARDIYLTVNGHRVEYDPPPKVAAFLRRLDDMISEPKVSIREMTGLAYSTENPLLAQGLFDGHRAVTKEVLADPAYAVMTDMLFRKRLVVDDVDVNRIAARYTLTVPEAARALGITESAVRQAIAAKRLASWVKGGQHYLNARAIESFELTAGGHIKAKGKRPPKATGGALEIVMGNAPGASLSLRTKKPIEPLSRDGHIVTGRLDEWKRVIVRTTGEGGKKRAFVLEPAATNAKVVHDPFSVSGRFTIVKTVNNAREAQALWEAADVE